MTKLVLLSNLRNNNPILKGKIKEFIGVKPFKLAYIPAQTDRDRKYFEAAKPEFLELGVTEFFYFDVDQEFQEPLLDEFMDCDGIFLSGGNTYTFLKNLQDRNITSCIKEMVQDGKLLIGQSAGSIIMSESIRVAEFYDENEVRLDRLDGLGLVDFEFMPHWQSYEDRIGELLVYSKKQETSIFACKDGDGIIVQDSDIELCGAISEIRGGEVVRQEEWSV